MTSTVVTHSTPPDPALQAAVIGLLKGVIYRETREQVWNDLLKYRSQVVDALAVLGLELAIDETEGYAFARSIPQIEGSDDTPRLVTRRELSYPVSLLLVLLRKKLAEFDASGGGFRLIVSRDQIVEELRVFVTSHTTDARLVDLIDGNISKACELGFLRRLKSDEHQFEVMRILKAFVDAQWLSDFNAMLAVYGTELDGNDMGSQ